jgi:tRNA (guanine6-N2)-methyltransferase
MKQPPKRSFYLCEAEVTAGLESLTEAELRKYDVQIVARRSAEIDFRFAGELSTLLELNTVQSISLIQNFPVPRPRALLSNEYLPLILKQIDTVLSLTPRAAFTTFFVAAAGSDTTIMLRIKTAIAKHTELSNSDEQGDLWVRIRPGKETGWDVLMRLSPRPLVTRLWRACNLQGALNAATAHAMIMLTHPKPADTFVNLGCGSATLLIERLAYGQCQLAVGIDNDVRHLHCAQANIDASGWGTSIQLQLADMIQLPLADASVSALCADLPFGQLSGTHQANQRLYPLILQEAARVARIHARFVLITHEIRLIENVLAHDKLWSLEQTFKINLRGLHPQIYVLQRR